MSKRTILVVDDQKINQIILGKLLSKEYKILYADNGQEALDVLKEHSEAISLVLLDLVMPVMNGYEVLKHMKKDPELSKIPVIVSSQNDDEDAEIKVLTLGAYDFIGKPYKAKIICQRIRNTIEFRETAAMINKVEKDELTDLYNKHFFLHKVQERIGEDTENQFDILCIGVEHFKLINETYGEAKGDEVLRHIANSLKECYQGDSLCGRFSGDEFYVFVNHKDGGNKDTYVKFIQKVNEFPIDMEIKIHCGCYNIGFEDIPIGIMCDRAKLVAEENRDKYDVLISEYDDSIREKLIDEQFITSNMQSALEERQFQVYYQPKYDLNSEKIAGAEALVRWIHPKRGFMSPGEFIPLFEKNGFITSLDQYVWETVCSDIRGWLDSGRPAVAVSVNVSRADIYNPKLAEVLIRLVEKYKIPFEYLHLEITESAYTENADQIVEAVKKLRKVGFIIEMDDFGSGYSSLNMLAEMPVDILKLDMKFVQYGVKQKESKGILNFVISLAKWLNLRVIAEGVETAQQIASLRSMDCHYVQGFYYAKPMPKSEFEDLILSSKIIPMSSLDREDKVEKPIIEQSKNLDRVMLIVDDIEVNRAVLSSIFLDEYRIVEKENGKEALTYLKEHYKEVDIVMLDLLMPIMDGFQLLKFIRTDENLKSLPVIITSQGDAESEQRALDMDADDFISKPYRAEIVSHRVHNAIANYKLQSIQLRELDDTRNKEQVLLDSIPGGIAIYRIKKDGRIATDYVSEGFAKICGYGVEEYLDFIKDDMRKSMVSEDIPYLEEDIEKSIKKNMPIHRVQRVYTKDHKKLMIRMDANVILPKNSQDDAVLYAVHTKVPNDSADVLEEQNRYRYILDNLDLAYFEYDADGETYVSDKYSLYNLSSADEKDTILSSKDLPAIHPDDLPALFEFLENQKSSRAKNDVVLRLKMKDGTYRWTEVLAFFEYAEDGSQTKMTGILRDVDKEWMRQNQRLQEALENAEKANQAKTDFLSRVSHDMRTPLNGILGLTKLMKDRALNEEIGFKKELEQMNQSGQYLMNLINDTLDVNIIESGKLQLKPIVCDGRTAFQNIIEMTRPEMEAKNITFDLKVGDLPFTQLFIDVGRVEQAVMNVLTNAAKFTPENGTVQFSIENLSEKDGIITDKIVIRDSGIGISDEFLKHIFEPFSQEHNNSKSIYEGTGLGMTISKECIELMGGSIEVESQVNKGTTFTIILPMQIATKKQIEEYSKQINNLVTDDILRGKNVLLCEDHPLNANIAIKLLERKGMYVDRAKNGRIGVDMFAKSGLSHYDAILMDIRMPEMDGLEATKAIRELDRKDAMEVPIIAMTANALATDVKNAINAGMSEHLRKPVEPDKLYQTLTDFIAARDSKEIKKVLIVDDMDVNRGFVKAAIKYTYKVLEASSGEEALEILENEKDISAVITDIQMPEMTGKELIEQIRKNHKYDDIAILANTIYGDHKQEDELLALGANDFVYKPASPRVILMRLKHILHHW